MIGAVQLKGPRVTAESGDRKKAEALPKTIEEQAEFLREYVRLQLWFVANWLQRHPGESFEQAIRTRVDIYRKTDLNPDRSSNTPTPGNLDDPRWLALEQQAREIYERNRNEEPSAFEEQVWEILRPLVEARVEREFNAPDPLDAYQCGSLKYDRRPAWLNTRLRSGLVRLVMGRPPIIFVHVGNRLAPSSFFADRTYLPECFFRFMDETSRKYHVGALTTDSWLNSMPRWLALFPAQWQENLSPPSHDVDWSQSCWGQFITARGTFNHALGGEMRKTGELPFKPRSSWCTYKDLRAHLHRYLDRASG